MEIHAYENYDNIKVFKSALGKVKHSRTFYITTDGNIRGGVLDDYKAESKDILNGERPRSRMLPLIFKLDNEDEIKDPAMYEKANPSINFLHELKKQVLKDVSDSEFREQLKIELYTKRFNLPAENVLTAVSSWDNIMATNEEIPALDGFDCIGGIDYASIRDFAGCVLIFKKDGKRFVIHHSFIHHTAYNSIKCKDKIDLAKEKGYCTIVYDETIKPTYISRWFLEMAQKYNILAITCDAFRASILKEEFTACGLPLVECRRGAYTHNKLAPLIEQMFAERTIKWGNDLLMRWYTNNTYVDTDAKGNKEYKKIEPIMRKTDGFHAFLHALTNDGLLLDCSDLKFYDCYSY